MERMTVKKMLFCTAALLAVDLSLVALTSCAAEPPAVVVPPMPSVNVIDATMTHPALSLPNCHLKGHVLVRTVDNVKPQTLVITEPEMLELKDKTLQLNANSAVVQKNHLLHLTNGMFEHVIDADAYYCSTATATY